jgi:predicted DNA-binding transcriptional regulator AlpA
MPKGRKTPETEAKNSTKSATDILDLDAVCALLQIDKKTAYALFARGEFGRKVGKRWLVSRGGLYRWLDRNGDHQPKRDENTRLLDQIENGTSPETKKAALREMIKRGVPISAGQK